MPHPNLSDEINRCIDSSTPDNGVTLSKLPAGTVLTVRVEGGDVYTIKILRLAATDPFKVLIQGGRYFPEQTEVYFSGSTWGGSMLKIHWVGVDMHMEIGHPNKPGVITTSAVESIQYKT